MFCARTGVLEGSRRVVLRVNINDCGGCAAGRWEPVLPVPGCGILFVEKARVEAECKARRVPAA